MLFGFVGIATHPKGAEFQGLPSLPPAHRVDTFGGPLHVKWETDSEGSELWAAGGGIYRSYCVISKIPISLMASSWEWKRKSFSSLGLVSDI
jgi:hypothetical protein